MLDFADAPYRFFPARPSLLMMELCQFANAHYILPSSQNLVQKVELRGAVEKVKEAAARGERLLFTPNHSTHSDPQIITEVHRQLGGHSCFMAAYDVFLRGKLHGWVMQRAGAFSVDREGSDRKSMAEAIRLLKAGRFPLTIFPEGNVYLQNDRVTPFMEGAAFLALKAQKELGEERPIHIVPVAIKLSHLTDVRAAVVEKLKTIAMATGEGFNDEANPVGELMRIGRDLLIKNLRQRGVLSPDEDLVGGELPEILRHSAERVIDGLETKMELEVRNREDLSDRVRKIRAAVHQVRTNPELEYEHQVAGTWADEAILALRILGYGQPYVAVNPTLDRVSETVEKLKEDLYGRWDPPLGPRDAVVSIGEPINLAKWSAEAAAAGGKPRQAVADLNRRMESGVQQGLDAINAENQRPGSLPF